MRHRLYEFSWIVGTAFWFIIWALTGIDTYLILAAGTAVVFLRAYVFQLQIVNYSLKLVGAGAVANSTDGESFDVSEPLGEIETSYTVTFTKDTVMPDGHVLKAGTKITNVIKVWAWNRLLLFELGTGKWGLANKWGGNEHGFLIVDERFVLRLPDGNIAILAAIETLRPIDISLIQLFRRVRPTDEDPRGIIPPQLWRKLVDHDRFDPRKSAIHIGLDPIVPVITVDRLGDPVLCLPGKDAVPGKHPDLPPTTFLLSDVVGKHSMVYDLRPEMACQTSGEAKAAREWAGKKIKELESTIQTQAQTIAALQAIANLTSPQPAPTQMQKVATLVGVPEDRPERR